MNRNFARMTRRDFIRLASLGGLMLSLPLLRFLPGSVPSIRSAQKSIYSMGTTVTILVEDELDQSKLDGAFASAFAEVRRLESLYTHFDPTSGVSTLNTTGELDGADAEVVSLLTSSTRFSEATEGSFDVTVQPALALFGRFLGGGPAPADADFEAAQKLIDFEKVTLSPHTVSLAKAGMAVTMDGIATGYIIDRAASALRSFGVQSALVQAGGTMVTVGSRADGSPWSIGVRDPLNEYGTVGTLHVKDAAVATTGDYENFFTPDKSFYHVVDPSTARSPLYSHSATVVAPTAVQADPLGVALMVKSPGDGLRLVDGMSKVDCLICTRQGALVRSEGLELTS